MHRNMARRDDGFLSTRRKVAWMFFGLWAVVLKQTGELVGQCGLTLQDWEGRTVPEVGYLFQKAHWHKGYATEAGNAGADDEHRHMTANRIHGANLSYRRLQACGLGRDGRGGRVSPLFAEARLLRRQCFAALPEAFFL